MDKIVTKRNGVWKAVYHFDHLFKLSGTADSKLKNTIKTVPVKLYTVQAVSVGYKPAAADIILTNSKANVLKVVFVDSKTFNKQYTIIGTSEQINNNFEHYIIVRNRDFTQHYFDVITLGYGLTTNIVNDNSMYSLLKQYKLPFDSTIDLSQVYKSTIVENIQKYKKQFAQIVQLFGKQQYTFDIDQGKYIKKLFGQSKLSSVKEIDLWLIDKKYVNSVVYQNDCKALNNNRQFDSLLLSSALIDRRIQDGSLVAIKVNSIGDNPSVTSIDHKSQRKTETSFPSIFKISSVAIAVDYSYVLVKFTNGLALRLGKGRDVGNHTIRYSFVADKTLDDLLDKPINRTLLDKLFVTIDGQYQSQSYKDTLGKCTEIINEITKLSGVTVQVDSMNNTSNLTDLYDKLSDDKKIYGYNLLNSLVNLLSFIEKHSLGCDLIFAYLYKVNQPRTYQYSFFRHIVD